MKRNLLEPVAIPQQAAFAEPTHTAPNFSALLDTFRNGNMIESCPEPRLLRSVQRRRGAAPARNLEYLSLEERAVGDIASALGLGQPSVSKHLQVLRSVGLVRLRRDGKRALYRTNAEGLKTIHDWTVHSSGTGAVSSTGSNDTPKPRRSDNVLTGSTLDNLTLSVNDEVLVNATLEPTFDSLIANLGRLNETPDGKPFPMTLEPWPGGRWFRDLGGSNGHLWGHVQAIKRPTLIEICGPLCMSYP